MIIEHALTVKDHLTQQEVDYMVKKANSLGIKKRKIYRVFSDEDSEGKHYYYEVDGMEPIHKEREE